MTLDLIDRDEDIVLDPEEQYQSIVRAFKRKRGFGLFFIVCDRGKGEEIINRVKQDVPNKKIEILRFFKPINTLYDKIERLTKEKEIDILFIRGIEYSLYQYELKKFGKITENQYNNFTSVPRILNHLNQQRERFRDNFKIRFVFILPPFARNYFIYRAPDFFDWSSGKWEFPMEPEVVEEKSRLILMEGDYEKYLSLSSQERVEKILEFEELLGEKPQKKDDRVGLFFELGNLLIADKEYEGAIASYEKAIEIKPDYHQAWNNRGNAQYYLGEYREAIASYEKAIEIKPDYHQAWYNRGNAQSDLGEYREAIASYEKAIQIKPDKDEACYNRGNAQYYLGEYREAIASYEKAIQIKPDKDEAWYNRGNAQYYLGEYREAIASYEKAIQIKPDYHDAWNNRGNAQSDLGEYREAIASYDKAIQFKPDYHQAWNNRGIAQSDLEEYREAIASYDKAIEIKPDDHLAWYNKACCYAKQDNLEEALENLKQAIALNPKKCREDAKTDSDFDKIREDERFKTLIFGT